jgi:metallophosphoesterase (TIGR00282 family)
MFKVLYIGDIAGNVGRDILHRVLPKIKSRYKLDLIIANAENTAGGKGVTREIIRELVGYGVDVCTGGDHTFDVKEFYEDLDLDLPFVRPANYEAVLPGRGYQIVEMGKKGTVAIIQLLGQELFTFNQRVRSPFWFVDELLCEKEIKNADIRLLEIHAESTGEKLALAWYVRDRVEAVVGTHTHVATADARILGDEKGSVAYVSDIGQVGPYTAALWVDFDDAIQHFKYPTKQAFRMARGGPKIFNSVLISFENNSPVRIDRLDMVLD